MKIILFANTDWYLYNFRLPLINELRQKNHDVVMLSPSGPYVQEFKKLGLRWIDFPIERSGMNPFKEIWTIIRLVRLYQREKPDIVHQFTVKCVLYGSIASKLFPSIKVINSVTGLGFAFTEGDKSRSLLRTLIMKFYKLFLYHTWIIFQNKSDEKLFLDNNLVDPSKEILIPGSGVDLRKFHPQPKSNRVPIVILPARLLWDKGIEDFVKAARILRKTKIEAKYVVVGEFDSDNPSGISSDQITTWESEGVIEYWGWQKDMPAIYKQADIICLPSYYREGLSKTLIEAAACGIPIITCDVPGCREVVLIGISGLLVPPRDPVSLADALKQLLSNPEERLKMGIQARKLAEDKFSSEIIIKKTFDFYEKVVN